MEQRNPAEEQASSCAETPTALDLAAAVRGLLTVPTPAEGAWPQHNHLLAIRAANLRDLLGSTLAVAEGQTAEGQARWSRRMVRAIGRLSENHPVAYPVPDEWGVPTCSLCGTRMEHEGGFWQHEDTGHLECTPCTEQGGAA